MAYMKRNEVLESTGLSLKSLRLLMANGRFPQPVRYWGRTVVWEERDVMDWAFEQRCRREQQEAAKQTSAQ